MLDGSIRIRRNYDPPFILSLIIQMHLLSLEPSRAGRPALRYTLLGVLVARRLHDIVTESRSLHGAEF